MPWLLKVNGFWNFEFVIKIMSCKKNKPALNFFLKTNPLSVRRARKPSTTRSTASTEWWLAWGGRRRGWPCASRGWRCGRHKKLETWPCPCQELLPRRIKTRFEFVASVCFQTKSKTDFNSNLDRKPPKSPKEQRFLIQKVLKAFFHWFPLLYISLPNSCAT